MLRLRVSFSECAMIFRCTVIKTIKQSYTGSNLTITKLKLLNKTNAQMRSLT